MTGTGPFSRTDYRGNPDTKDGRWLRRAGVIKAEFLNGCDTEAERDEIVDLLNGGVHSERLAEELTNTVARLKNCAQAHGNDESVIASMTESADAALAAYSASKGHQP